jgi:hypothetical protein
MSRKPSVVSSPTVAPDRWRIVLVATVVPWKTRSTSVSESERFSHASAIPSTVAIEGSAGVLGTLWTEMPASPTMKMSVNVPPTSTPIRCT